MYEARAESAEKEAAAARRQAQEAARTAEEKLERDSAQLAASYPGKMQFPYRFAAHQSPFEVDAMYHDGRFTYIRANPEEPPALYEIKDGKPSLVEFHFRDGMYVVPKILDSGYLAIGKRKLNFYRSRP